MKSIYIYIYICIYSTAIFSTLVIWTQQHTNNKTPTKHKQNIKDDFHQNHNGCHNTFYDRVEFL